MKLRDALLGLLVALAASSLGQQIDHENSFPSSIIRGVTRAADDAGVYPFPDLRTSEIGTLVTVEDSFDECNLYVSAGLKQCSEEKLVALARKIAKEAGWTKTRLTAITGQRLRAIKLDISPNLKTTTWRSSTSIEIGKVLKIIEASELPKPLGFGVNVSKSLDAQLAGRKVEKTTAFLPKDIAESDVLDVKVERHWYGVVMLVLLAVALLSASIGIPISLVRSALRAKRPEDTPQTPVKEVPKSLEETQSAYNKGKKFGTLVPALLLPLFILIPSLLGPAMRDVKNWLPDIYPLWILLAILPTLIAALASKVIRRVRGIPPDAATTRMMRPIQYLLLPLLVTAGTMMAITLLPSTFQAIPVRVRLFLPLVILPVSLVVSFFLYTRAKKEDQLILGPGDFDYDTAMEMAAKAKVRVRRVEINTSMSGVNAAASLFGRVYVTEGLRNKVEPEMRGAIIAHEIGHLKGQHAPTFTLLSLLFSGVLMVVLIRSSEVLSAMPEWVKSVLDSPFIFWVPQTLFSMIVLSPIRRRAEFYADKFALEQTRDYSLVATALAKVHLLNRAPHTFRPGHERIASHPSLTKRLDSLRKVAQEMGLPVDDTEVNKLFHGSAPELQPTPSEA
ncbi:MAG: M48 family metalloprotease [Armatimonadetes bacterium]|nr:M48 family metalloprotease [Armatimonadota bacterium]